MKQQINKADHYLVLGNPIKHSRSPQIHAAFARQTGEVIEYNSSLVAIDAFTRTISAMVANGTQGFNITLPFKQQAFELADTLSSSASLAGAVNTLSIRDNNLHGDNTDGVGLVRDLTLNHDFDFKDKDVLLLGAGGAVRGVIEPIIKQQPRSITIANRTVVRAQELVVVFSDLFSIAACAYEDLDQPYDLIINGTSASLEGQQLPVPDITVNTNSYLYDMMYSATPTVFNQWGSSLGAKQTLDGLGMLVEQAAEAFFIWRSVRPQTQSVICDLRRNL